jgi:uncharacterized protein
MRRLAFGSFGLVAILAAGSGIVGHELVPGFLHPWRAAMSAQRLARVDAMLERVQATREEFDVRVSDDDLKRGHGGEGKKEGSFGPLRVPQDDGSSMVAGREVPASVVARGEVPDLSASRDAQDGIVLRGWKIRSASPNGDWVILFHGQGDNRAGMTGFAAFLLPAGYSVVMMDSRAQGESAGDEATYGWKERYDTRAIVSALESSEKVNHVFALGVSMGAGIALQSAAVEPRIEAVVAEDPFANMREVSYDYGGFERWAWLGKTIFRPATMEGMRTIQEDGGFDPDQVSPERAVAERPFPVLLICGTADHKIPCRHAEMIYKAARGPKQLWIVRGARHASALGQAPEEYKRRVLAFFGGAGGN